MIESLYDLLGISAVSNVQSSLILIFCLVLLFFGSLVVFNALLSLITSIFNFER